MPPGSGSHCPQAISPTSSGYSDPVRKKLEFGDQDDLGESRHLQASGAARRQLPTALSTSPSVSDRSGTFESDRFLVKKDSPQNSFRHRVQSPLAGIRSPCRSSSFYPRPESSFPASGDDGWYGKGLPKKPKDTTKLDRAMEYMNEKVNSTGNLNRGSRGPRGSDRGQNSKQSRLGMAGYGHGSKMLMAAMKKNNDKENKESTTDLMPSMDPDLMCKKEKTPDLKLRGRDMNSNHFGSIINGNLTPVGRKQSSFGIATSSTPSTSAIAPHQMGFKNYKNTCYMLAPLQVLQGIPSIVSSSVSLANLIEEWEEDRPILDNNLDDKASRLALPWSLLCKARQEGDSVQALTQVQELKTAMGEVSESFQGSSMQDAHDFAAQFIDNLKEGVMKMDKNKGRVNPVVDNLEMEWEETLLCERCGVKTVRRQKEVGLFCSLNEDLSPIDLRELIESSVEPETIHRNCEVSDCRHNQARQSRRLTAMPRVLLVYLKRMAWAANQGAGEQEGKNIKVTRVVDIPSVVSLLPVKASDCKLPLALPLPSASNITISPVVNLLSPVKNSATVTPSKFSGKTVEELAAMSESDQEEYALHRSMKESLGVDQNMTEEQQLKAALEASMKDINSPAGDMAASSYEKELQETIRLSIQDVGSPEERGLATPTKAPLSLPLPQRRLSTAFDSPLKTPVRASKRLGESNVGEGGSVPGKRSKESDVRRPLTEVEEEEDFRRALELSLASSTPSTSISEPAPTPGKNMAAVVAGPPKYHYRLHSVVRHLGSSPLAGHYIADVFRFDTCGWWRYDDSQVTQTSEERVMGGNGRREGYIFTYVHQPQWDLWTARKKDS